MRSFFENLINWLKKLLDMVKSVFKKEDPATELPDFPDRPDPTEIVCYYGCPNSKRTEKLQLEKRRVTYTE